MTGTACLLRRMVVVTGCAALTAGLAGCSHLPDPTGGVAIVVGAHSNMPRPALVGQGRDVLDVAVEAQSYVTVVVADGAPFIATRGCLDVEGDDRASQDASRAQNRQRVEHALADAAAESPETDLLGALDDASRSIAGAAGAHTVVVVDSGLSTVAPLDLSRPGVLDADPAAIVAGLEQSGALPDLAGDEVVFQGLGDTADPQPALDPDRRSRLVALWTAIAHAAGAVSVDVDPSPLTGPSAPDLPPVTPVGP